MNFFDTQELPTSAPIDYGVNGSIMTADTVLQEATYYHSYARATISRTSRLLHRRASPPAASAAPADINPGWTPPLTWQDMPDEDELDMQQPHKDRCVSAGTPSTEADEEDCGEHPEAPAVDRWETSTDSRHSPTHELQVLLRESRQASTSREERPSPTPTQNLWQAPHSPAPLRQLASSAPASTTRASSPASRYVAVFDSSAAVPRPSPPASNRARPISETTLRGDKPVEFRQHSPLEDDQVDSITNVPLRPTVTSRRPVRGGAPQAGPSTECGGLTSSVAGRRGRSSRSTGPHKKRKSSDADLDDDDGDKEQHDTEGAKATDTSRKRAKLQHVITTFEADDSADRAARTTGEGETGASISAAGPSRMRSQEQQSATRPPKQKKSSKATASRKAGAGATQKDPVIIKSRMQCVERHRQDPLAHLVTDKTQCPYCETPFTRSKDLLRHLKPSNFPCPRCGIPQSRPDTLKRHMERYCKA
ncbi:hypothetical protein BV25DRAFT_1671260 [Artomyces pyxidatus]|uniref:Uncharacterized protein n=1 Tax=Artomyces pyxidatus TaxID=48021 RepID=A0ACB8SHN3_9AGAM|nr:hypothetical protein BV25DRAFT_1671260 [Artomyces pyxidatus]